MAVGVGYDWDAAIILPGSMVMVPESIKTLIERVWSEYNRGPQETRESDDLDPPPRNWKKQLRDYAASVTPSASGNVSGSAERGG